MNRTIPIIFLLCAIYALNIFAEQRAAVFNIGANIGAYLPSIDKTKMANGQPIFPVYRCMFGQSPSFNGPWQPMFGLNFDYFLTQGSAGSVTVGLGAFYMYAGGFLLQEQKNNTIAQGCGTQVNERVDLHLFQFRLPQFTYFVDAHQENFPLLPFIRLGFVGTGYAFGTNVHLEPNGDPTTTNIETAGFSLGYEAAVGVLFMLDIFDPNLAREARENDSFNHTYLKAEMVVTQSNGFGLGKVDLSSEGVFGINLPIVFNGALVMQF